MWVCNSLNSRADTPWRTEVPAECAVACVLSSPRVITIVVDEPEVTVTTSSLEVSGSIISVYGNVVGKPLIELRITPVVLSP